MAKAETMTKADGVAGAEAVGGLAAFARALIESDAGPDMAALAQPAPAPQGGGRFELSLDELLSNEAGELVLESGTPSAVELHAGEALLDAGIKEAHTTADGADVSGFSYMSFASGVTVYYPPDVDLNLVAG